MRNFSASGQESNRKNLLRSQSSSNLPNGKPDRQLKRSQTFTSGTRRQRSKRVQQIQNQLSRELHQNVGHKTQTNTNNIPQNIVACRAKQIEGQNNGQNSSNNETEDLEGQESSFGK